MMRDILKIMPWEREKMSLIELIEAQNYAITTYRLRQVGQIQGAKKSHGRTQFFDVDEDYDVDPNFYSRVGK